MSEKKDVNPILRQVLELGPTVIFFLLYMKLKEQSFDIGGTEYSGFIIATVLFVPVLLVSIGILWKLTGQLSRLQIFTAFVVIFFGALTAWFNDERFFKMKTTIVYGFFAAILGTGLLQGRSYLAYVLNEMLPMEETGWMILTRRLCLGFTVLAGANELVWRTMSTDLWVKIETFGFPILLFLYLWWQVMALQKYLIDPADRDL
ncbi:inner membrane-spanning protein YciB [Pseudodonghicola flavimaris]|uniref:Inner membrane-spanning protein YciB n=1 Tax=Pseudodonghicola flavimaris TaxID=3050036 RepID=A0ABT7EUU9_9RHOB|nr:inner membrane-spanning protein YciB [Pseudodonghicola flavimaris]MDK3016118.1 inner membrane-spanning protein YciB [Pseudodonghicola flavimaris]